MTAANFPAARAPSGMSLPPGALGPPGPGGAWPERPRSVWRRGPLLLLLMLPTLLAGLYALAIAPDVYVAEAQLSVRGNRAQPAPALGGLLGVTPAANNAEEAFAVQAFIHSHDAVRGLEARLPLREFYGRREADRLNRLPDGASMERLVAFHRGMVTLRYDERSGILTLRVQGFRPEDAHAVAVALLDLSEALVNRLRERAIGDSLRAHPGSSDSC